MGGVCTRYVAGDAVAGPGATGGATAAKGASSTSTAAKPAAGGKGHRRESERRGLRRVFDTGLVQASSCGLSRAWEGLIRVLSN